MALVVETVGIGKMGIVHADFGCLLVHKNGKLFLAPCQMDSQRTGRIVSGNQHDAVKQVDNAQLLVPGKGRRGSGTAGIKLIANIDDFV
ncbi:hypothetical protein SDC9_193840 [bioreactor metagenome]|uniref:Uncharacterized protein n=1 Tax=bioreactor metagenome TaxID=1076179 RepID=A0A645I5T7_9ZZZZ